MTPGVHAHNFQPENTIVCNFFPYKILEPFELQRKDTISWQTFRRCDIQKKLVQREGVNGWKMNFLI